jgi:hypothetical protein
MELLTQVLVQLGGTAVVAILLSKWLLGRAEKEIDRRLQERHAVRLEELRKQHQKELRALQDIEVRLSAQFASVMTMHSAMHNATVERRVQAVERLWQYITKLRAAFPAPLATIDFISVEHEYASLRQSKGFDEALRAVTEEKIAQTILQRDEPAEPLRPFLPSLLWAWFYAYRAFLGRVALVAIMPQTRLLPWYRDEPSTNLLRAVLSEDEYAAVMNRRSGRL